MSSVFTKIINRELPAQIVWEDDRVISFLPNGHFINPGHVLVVPKQEVDEIFDLDADLYLYLWRVAQMIAQPLKPLTQAKRIGIAVEGFTVPHVHIHLCPLFTVSELDPQRDEPWSLEEQAIFLDTLRCALEGKNP